MPRPPLPDDVIELLEQPNPAVIASNRPDGQPVSVATWYLWQEGRVLVNLDQGRKRLEYLRADPRASITVLAADSWYTHVSLQGTVTELVDDEGLVDIDRISAHYTGSSYPVRDRARVSARLDVERWHGWGAVRND